MTNQIMSIDQQTLNNEWKALVENTPSEYGNPIADRIAKIMNLKLNGIFVEDLKLELINDQKAINRQSVAPEYDAAAAAPVKYQVSIDEATEQRIEDEQLLLEATRKRCLEQFPKNVLIDLINMDNDERENIIKELVDMDMSDKKENENNNEE